MKPRQRILVWLYKPDVSFGGVAIMLALERLQKPKGHSQAGLALLIMTSPRLGGGQSILGVRCVHKVRPRERAPNPNAF